MEGAKEVEDFQFTWGKKRGIGGKKKNVRFYESFTFDHEEYTLYDCVYAYKDGELEPYIGKIIKIWEQSEKMRRVKLLWFFRPSDIAPCLEGAGGVLENEIFLASGEGLGLANINPLEAIAGKCNVVCISKDRRNPQPSDEEIKNADFVFHRTFDVGRCEVLDDIDDNIAGIEVKCIFNRPGCQKSSVPQKVVVDVKEFAENNVAESQKVISSQATASKIYQNMKRGDDSTSVLVRQKQQSTEAFVSRDSGFDGKKGKGTEGPKVLARQKSSLAEVKLSKDSGELDDRPHKKQKLDGPVRVSVDKKNKSLQNLSLDEGKDTKTAVPRDKVVIQKELSRKPSFDDKNKKLLQNLGDEGKHTKTATRDAITTEKALFKKRSFDDKLIQRTEGAVSKPSANDFMNVGNKKDHQLLEVTRRPDADRSNWFRNLPWEDRMQSAYDEGRLVLLQNLDPTYTSAEVEDIVWHGFKEKCEAKMIQCTAVSVPHIGQALIILKTREAAEKVVRKLVGACLLLSNGRPLVGSIPKLCPPGKQSTFSGHLVIDKLRLQRGMRDAVSTSHCSQPNTLEYDMATEWCLLQARFERTWEKIFKHQEDEMRKLHFNSKLP